MAYRAQRIHRCLMLAFDVLAVDLAWRFTEAIRLVVFPSQLETLEPVAGTAELIVLIWIPVAYWFRLYSWPSSTKAWNNIGRVVECSLLLSMIALLVLTVLGRAHGNRGSEALIVIAPAGLLLFAAGQALAFLCYRIAERQWISKTGFAVVGTATAATQFIRYRHAWTSSGQLRGLIVPEESELVPASSPMRVLGTTRQLAELINQEDLDRVIVLNDALREEERERCRRISGRMGVTISWVLGDRVGFETLTVASHDGLLRLDLVPTPFTKTQERIKRALDLIFGSLLTVIVSPLMLLIAAAIRLSSPGPVLYTAPRVGYGGRHFTFLKFRSMYIDSNRKHVASANEKDGHLFKIKGDPRITPLGRWLRRYSLDELPQLFNVLKGDMSLVGPRPLPANDLDPDGMSARFSAWSEHRSRVRPGITGLWQIKGRSDLAFEQMMTLDLEYIRTWSLGLDIRILLQTPEFVLSGRGAY